LFWTGSGGNGSPEKQKALPEAEKREQAPALQTQLSTGLSIVQNTEKSRKNLRDAKALEKCPLS
jgi:hypothetical protein